MPLTDGSIVSLEDKKNIFWVCVVRVRSTAWIAAGREIAKLEKQIVSKGTSARYVSSRQSGFHLLHILATIYLT